MKSKTQKKRTGLSSGISEETEGLRKETIREKKLQSSIVTQTS